MKIVYCFLSLLSVFPFTKALRIYSSSANAFYDDDAMYGSPRYIQMLESTTRTLQGIEDGYEDLRLYFVVPIHFAPELTDLEIVVVTDEENMNDTQMFEDLSDDIRNNIDDELIVKLIIVPRLRSIPRTMRIRLRSLRPTTPTDPTEQALRITLQNIATELRIGITNIEFHSSPAEIHVTLTSDAERLRSRFILMARTHTRKVIRVVD